MARATAQASGFFTSAIDSCLDDEYIATNIVHERAKALQMEQVPVRAALICACTRTRALRKAWGMADGAHN
jgi:hypothetical protein